MKKSLPSSESFAQLVEQVRNNPNDAEARLVLADAWLEQGNPQGQLMLWTAQWEQMNVGDDSYHELRRKCDALRKELNDSFCARWGVRSVTFEHGYVTSVQASDPKAWQQLGRAIQEELALLSKVVLGGIQTLDSLKAWLPHLSSTPALTSLNLGANTIGDAGVKALAESPHLQSLTSLDLGDNYIGEEGAKALAESPHLQNLTLLDLEFNDIGDAGAKALVASPYLKNLTSLNLEYNYIGDAGAKALAASPYLKNLTSLDLAQNRIGEEGAKALAESPLLQNLTSLNLACNEISETGAKALAASPYLKNLTSLNL
jgi:Ran GTPase-activating protein (RanGAP) involved in mRNA processing and transport